MWHKVLIQHNISDVKKHALQNAVMECIHIDCNAWVWKGMEYTIL